MKSKVKLDDKIFTNPRVVVGDFVKFYDCGETDAIYKVAADTSYSLHKRILVEVTSETKKLDGDIVTGWPARERPELCKEYKLNPKKDYWYVDFWKKPLILLKNE